MTAESAAPWSRSSTCRSRRALHQARAISGRIRCGHRVTVPGEHPVRGGQPACGRAGHARHLQWLAEHGLDLSNCRQRHIDLWHVEHAKQAVMASGPSPDNMNTATNRSSRWLFPGRRAGQPMNPTRPPPQSTISASRPPPAGQAPSVSTSWRCLPRRRRCPGLPPGHHRQAAPRRPAPPGADTPLRVIYCHHPAGHHDEPTKRNKGDRRCYVDTAGHSCGVRTRARTGTAGWR